MRNLLNLPSPITRVYVKVAINNGDNVTTLCNSEQSTHPSQRFSVRLKLSKRDIGRFLVVAASDISGEMSGDGSSRRNVFNSFPDGWMQQTGI